MFELLDSPQECERWLMCRILVWEDGFCDFAACASGTGNESARGASSSFLSARQLRLNVDDEPEAMNPELFFKMSHEVYNYGEGSALALSLSLPPNYSVSRAPALTIGFLPDWWARWPWTTAISGCSRSLWRTRWASSRLGTLLLTL